LAIKPNALVTLIEFKTFLQLPDPAAPDAELDPVYEMFINSTSERAEKFCRRFLATREDHDEVQSGNGRRELLLKQWPVLAVASVYIDPDRAFGAETLIDPSEYVITTDSEGNGIGLERLDGRCWDRGRHNIKITYDCGFGTADGDDLPDDIRMGINFWAQFYQQRMKEQDLGIHTKSKDTENITISSEMPALVREIFMNYKRTEFEMEDQIP
jgi:hypothetical protein